MINPLFNLLANNNKLGYFAVKNEESEIAKIYIYDVIVSDDYFGGISAKTIIKAINEINAPEIHLRIDSPGGDVFPAQSVAQHMRESSTRFVCHVDGMCASAATYFAMAADDSVISPGGLFMIHNSWTFAAGDHNELDKVSDVLQQIDGSMADIYAAKTGKDVEVLRQMMDRETNLIGSAAVDEGFIDRVAMDDGTQVPGNRINWDMSAYGHNPPELSPSKAKNESISEPDRCQADHAKVAAQEHNHRKRRLALKKCQLITD